MWNISIKLDATRSFPWRFLLLPLHEHAHARTHTQIIFEICKGRLGKISTGVSAATHSLWQENPFVCVNSFLVLCVYLCVCVCACGESVWRLNGSEWQRCPTFPMCVISALTKLTLSSIPSPFPFFSLSHIVSLVPPSSITSNMRGEIIQAKPLWFQHKPPGSPESSRFFYITAHPFPSTEEIRMQF